MMEKLAIALVLVAVAVIQSTWLFPMHIMGATPDLVFLLVIFLALHRSSTVGLWAGFFGGVLQDVAGGVPLGFNALLLSLLAYFAGYLRKKFFEEQFPAQVLMVIFFTTVHQALAFFWLNTFVETHFSLLVLLQRALFLCLWHAILGPLAFWVMKKIFKGHDPARSAPGGRAVQAGPVES
jgi:rod shape-determining protein MreD